MKKSSSAIGRVTMSSGPASKKNVSLDDIHKKIVSSPALNGGFETLLYKIDKIEQSQGQLVSKIDKIHDAMYDPQEGLFSMISQQKLDSEIKLGEINKNVLELKLWKNHKDKSDEKEEDELDKNKAKLASIEKTVETLNENKNTVWSLTKWLAAALGGAIVTILLAYLRKKFNI